jgi:hypothetical protein
MYDMPKIELDEKQFDEHELGIARAILNSGGVLRASKPPISSIIKPADDTHYGQYREYDFRDASIYYVWRNVAFYLSPIDAHHCMPIGADYYIPLSYADRRLWTKRLDAIVDKITSCVPVHKWHGVMHQARLNYL